MLFSTSREKQDEKKEGGNMKRLIAFIVFSSVSCMVAAASMLWQHVRRFVHGSSFLTPAIRERHGVSDAIAGNQPLKHAAMVSAREQRSDDAAQVEWPGAIRQRT
jgi:hypothetical protein